VAISAKEAIERIERQQRRIKRQNEHIKENYDRVSITLPKGTKERIKAKGETVNGYITRLVIADLGQEEAKTDLSDVPFMN
jgi:hypothetical protein